MSSDRTPADVVAELLDAHRDDPYSTAEPVSLPGIADLCQERGEHKSASAIRQAVQILASRQRFYAVQLGDECGWVVMSDDPINGTPVWRFDEFPPDPSRGEKAHRLARLLNTAAGFRVVPIPDDNTRAEVLNLVNRAKDRRTAHSVKKRYAIADDFDHVDLSRLERMADLLAAAYLDEQPQDPEEGATDE